MRAHLVGTRSAASSSRSSASATSSSTRSSGLLPQWLPGWRGPVVSDGTLEVWENPAYEGEAFLYGATRFLAAESRPALAALGEEVRLVALVEEDGPRARLRRLRPGAGAPRAPCRRPARSDDRERPPFAPRRRRAVGPGLARTGRRGICRPGTGQRPPAGRAGTLRFAPGLPRLRDRRARARRPADARRAQRRLRAPPAASR